MKRRVVPLLLILAVAETPSALADDDSLPSLMRPEQIGRLVYFRGPRALTRYAPLALSSSLTCEPRATALDRICILRITNNVSGEDLSQMSILQADNPRLQFTPVPSSLIEDIHEDFQKMDRDIPMSGVKSPRTLALSADPYVSIKIDKSKKIVARLLAAYEKDGLGTFTAEFSFSGERTEDYLELLDTSPLKSLMAENGTGAKPSDLKPRLEESIRSGGLASNNLTEAESLAVAYRTILGNFFKLTRESMVYPRSELTEGLESSLVLVAETRSPVRGRCQASLPLKHGARATVSCQEVQQ